METIKKIMIAGCRNPRRFYVFCVELLLSILTIVGFFGLPPISTNWRQEWQKQAQLKLQSSVLSDHNECEVERGARLAAMACSACPGESFVGVRICDINPIEDETITVGMFFMNTTDGYLLESFNKAVDNLAKRRAGLVTNS